MTLPQLAAELARATSIPVIASGGLASIADVEALTRPEYRMLAGAITGRAVYQGTLDFAAAQQLADSLSKKSA